MAEFKLDGGRQAPELGDAGEFFAALSDHSRELLKKRGLSEKQAIELVNDLVLHLAETFHGEGIYITKKPVVFAKQMAAYADLQFMSYRDVDTKYGWSRGYSLKVQQQIREKQQRRAQLRLQFNK